MDRALGNGEGACDCSDEGIGGALVKIGTSYFPTFEDTGFYGANMQPSPSFLPTNPPSAAGPQGLFTRITAVSGTAFTLANAASAAVSGTCSSRQQKRAGVGHHCLVRRRQHDGANRLRQMDDYGMAGPLLWQRT